MAYNFEDRHDYLRTRMRTVNSRSINYGRGSGGETIDATVYEMTADDLVMYGLTMEVRHFSLVVNIADIETALGSGELPERNDTIEDEALGIELRVEPLGSEPVFKYTNHQRKAVRIHAVEVGEL